MRAEPIASGGMTPLPPLITVHPMVRTRKKVPINSTTYLFIAALTPARASGKLRATLKHARIVEDTGVRGLHKRVSQFKDFNQQFDFLKSKPPLNAIRYRYESGHQNAT